MTAVAMTTKTQEAVDRFYMQHGACCAGCDWWHHYGSVLGECRRSAPVSAEQRYSMAQMDRLTFLTLDESAGHIVTNREHHCGDFKDSFDWPSLPPHYLRRIGWDRHEARWSQGRGDSPVGPASKVTRPNEQEAPSTFLQVEQRSQAQGASPAGDKP